MKAVRFHAPGGPEVLRVDEVELAPLQEGEARVRHTAIGVNMIDCYHRSGLYAVPLPGIPGVEAVGVVEEIKGTSAIQVGDRVAYKSRAPGSYAEKRNLEVARLEKIPDGLADDVVAASFVKGMTAEYLTCRLFDVKPKHVVVVTAAAGGVGQNVVRICKKKQARVIAVVGSEEKKQFVVAMGVDAADVFVSRGPNEGLGKAIRAHVAEGADVVYDSVGRDTFPTLLDAVQTRGLFVSYGNASGPVDSFAPALLAQKGSLFFTRPALHDYVDDPYDQNISSARVFNWLEDGTLQPNIQQRFALKDAGDAHRMLEARRTTGSLILLP